MGTSFLLREFLQLVFPSIVALFLFTPLIPGVRDRVTLEGALAAAVVMGLLTSHLRDVLADALLDWLPLIRTRMSEVRALIERAQSNWDRTSLLSLFTKDENDMLDVVGSFAITYKATAFYLTLYLILNAGILAVGVVEAFRSGPTAMDGVSAIWRTFTPMLGGWGLPTIGVFLSTGVLIDSLLDAHVSYMRRIFDDDGLIDIYGFKNQGNLVARRIWGRAVSAASDTPMDGVLVTLTTTRASATGVTTSADTHATDSKGRFVFDEDPRGILRGRLSVRMDSYRSDMVEFTSATVRPFRLWVEPTLVRQDRGKSENAGASSIARSSTA